MGVRSSNARPRAETEVPACHRASGTQGGAVGAGRTDAVDGAMGGGVLPRRTDSAGGLTDLFGVLADEAGYAECRTGLQRRR